MALIKCSECGKEISDKAKVCIHCGCPVFKENIKNEKKKKWEELSNEEKIKINHYRNRIKEFWIGYRQTGVISAIIASILLLISFFNIYMIFLLFIPAIIEIICLLNIDKEDKKWYEKNIDKIYEEEIIN